jgi:hypothetical protein
MPCDYSKYPTNWKSEIRPRILERAGNKCELCLVGNGEYIFRGYLDGIEVYQYGDGSVHNAKTGEFIEKNVYALIEALNGDINSKAIKVVLTVMHLDHDTTNNEDDNLKAACQKCHLNYDKEHHKKNSKETIRKKKKLQNLFQ